MSTGRCAFAFAAACLAGSLLGCTVVRIQTPGADGVEVKQRFGIVSLEIKPGAGATLVESSGFGASNGFQGFSLGYHNATVAALSADKCRLVLWIKTGEELKELNQLLSAHGTDICVVRPDDLGRGGQ